MATLTAASAVILASACSEVTPTDPGLTSGAGRANGVSTIAFTLRCQTAFTFASVDPAGNPIIQIDENCTFGFPKGRVRLATGSAQQTLFPDGTISSQIAYDFGNGDRLVGSFAGVATPPDANGHLKFTGTETFNRGSGRFTGVEGWDELTGEATIVDPTTISGVGEYRARGTLRLVESPAPTP
jgi:hypothetical protein